MTAQTILPANSVTGGYDVENSLRFASGSSDFLSRTPGSASNRKTFTISYWVKRAKLGAEQAVCGVHENSSHNFIAMFNDVDQIEMKFKIGGANNKLQTNAKFRDISAWYHIVLAVDTTDGTAANRFKLYVNGVQVSSFDTAAYPNQDVNTEVNLDGLEFRIGESGNDDDRDYLDGYLAEFCLIDGSQLAADQFGEFDSNSGIWKPIESVADLTFGTNGFYLEFKQSGTSANANGLGADTSGNDDHFAVNNLTAEDQSTDTCTNNFATFNSLTTSRQSGGVVAYSQGNTKIITSYSNTNYLRYPQAYTTLGVTTGKWYAEFKPLVMGSAAIGVSNTGEFGSDGSTNPYAGYAASGAVYTNGGEYRANNSSTGSQGTYAVNNIIGVALDLDNLAIYWHKNGTYINSGDPTSGSSKTGARAILTPTTPGGFYTFTAGADNTAVATIAANFGSPSFGISSGNADARGHGNFEYAVPSGYFALCTKNLAEFG